jgi:redox-sensitive bicupin YhaK (pirin superfamily)
VTQTTETTTPIITTVALGPQWPTLDPFLFCAHHNDDYPAGDGAMAPKASLDGRPIGNDFSELDGWSMYHGSTVPGFPQHPHRGFETVTYCRDGYIDHSDSLGATARFGRGDVQWMTAGGGVVHCEMFPLVNTHSRNPTELFQVWLNLPAEDKMVDAYFTMLWEENIPKLDLDDGGQITVIAGGLAALEPAAPPPNSWAARPEAHIGMWHIVLPPHSSWTIPATAATSGRMLYLFEGNGLEVGGSTFDRDTGIQLQPAQMIEITSGDEATECLLLQGTPIGETVVQYGPFVMNTREEIQQAFDDYQRTGFGGWPWGQPDPVHPAIETRFAVHADGRREQPPTEPS